MHKANAHESGFLLLRKLRRLFVNAKVLVRLGEKKIVLVVVTYAMFGNVYMLCRTRTTWRSRDVKFGLGLIITLRRIRNNTKNICLPISGKFGAKD